MKIVAVEAIPLRVPNADVDNLDGSQDDVIVKIATDEGIVGVGEADASPEIIKAIVDAPASHAWSKGLPRTANRTEPAQSGEALG